MHGKYYTNYGVYTASYNTSNNQLPHPPPPPPPPPLKCSRYIRHTKIPLPITFYILSAKSWYENYIYKYEK